MNDEVNTTTEMTPEQAEKYVRERWKRVEERGGEGTPFVYEVWVWEGVVANAFPNYLAAADYTRQHKRKIAEKQEEVEWMQVNGGISPPAKRILAVLESQLAELMRGWKKQA